MTSGPGIALASADVSALLLTTHVGDSIQFASNRRDRDVGFRIDRSRHNLALNGYAQHCNRGALTYGVLSKYVLSAKQKDPTVYTQLKVWLCCVTADLCRSAFR